MYSCNAIMTWIRHLDRTEMTWIVLTTISVVFGTYCMRGYAGIMR